MLRHCRISFARLGVTLLAFVTTLALVSPAVSQGGKSDDLVRLADRVAKEVESLRGWKFREPVKKAVYSEAELRGYLERRIEAEYPADELRGTEAFLVMVGALPDSTPLVKTVTEVLMSQVGGFYDPEAKSFFMIDRQGQEFAPFVERVLIAHELTHALDDQVVSLDSLMQARERTQDAEFVVGALVEGSATALMTQYVAQAQRSGEVGPEDFSEMMESEMERSRVFFEAPPYFQTLLANYSCGMAFLLKGDLSALLGGAGSTNSGENFLHAVKEPPRSGEQILHPEKYWNPKKRDDPVRVEDAGVDAALNAAGFRVTHRDVAGELVMGVLTVDPGRTLNPMAAGLPAYWTTTASSGWGGDRFYLLERVSRARASGDAGLWITLWDTPQDRDEFARAYLATAGRLGATAIPLGEEGEAYVYGLTDTEGRALAERIAAAPLRFTRGEESWTP